MTVLLHNDMNANGIHKVNIQAVYFNLLIFQIPSNLLPPTSFHFKHQLR